MSKLPDDLRSTVNRPLGLRARGDLQHVTISTADQTCFVLKDPLTLELFHLTREEMFLFDLLREPVSWGELKKDFESRFAPRTISLASLHQAVNQMAQQSMLRSIAAGQGEQLLQRDAQKQAAARWQKLFSVLSFRVASWDAEPIIEALSSKVRWIFSPLLAVVGMAILGYALWLLASYHAAMWSRLPTISELTSPRHVLLWLSTLAGLKVIHELAHALTCRHFGARCHEMGVMLLVLFPALYCDVSDIWRLPSKWQRMAVSAAGMIAEIVIAAAALIGWWVTEPGLMNTWLLGVAMIASVGTFAVNANPLLRYDGYYLLSDLWEIPNLGPRAHGYWSERLGNWLLAQSTPADPVLTERQLTRMAIYAIGSKLYALVLFVAIFAMLLAVARPLHLDNLVLILCGVTGVGMVAGPVRGAVSVVGNPSLRARLRPGRISFLSLAVLAVIATVLFFPVEHTVVAPAVFVPVESQPLYATERGELEFALPAGSEVHAGDVVARMIDPQVDFAIEQRAGELAVKKTHYEQLQTLRALDNRISLQLPTAKAEWEDAGAELAEYRAVADRLVLRAPADGTVLAPPDREPAEATDRLNTWSGSPLAARNQRCLIEPGTMLCTIGDPHRLTALVSVAERDIAEVQTGSAVKILLSSAPLTILTGQVTQIASRATEPAGENAAVDHERAHVVEVQLDAQDAHLLVGSRGMAKIVANRQTLAQMSLDYLKRRLRMPW